MFYEAVIKPEMSRGVEQKNALRLRKRVIDNKYTVALPAERKKREGRKIMGFFQSSSTGESQPQRAFIKNLTALG